MPIGPLKSKQRSDHYFSLYFIDARDAETIQKAADMMNVSRSAFAGAAALEAAREIIAKHGERCPSCGGTGKKPKTKKAAA